MFSQLEIRLIDPSEVWSKGCNFCESEYWTSNKQHGHIPPYKCSNCVKKRRKTRNRKTRNLKTRMINPLI